VLVAHTAGGRRELRKAQTRAEVRETAQRLFAERGFDEVTTADIAAAADVAVQTVFNHFETKEDLFFDGRTPWVEGSAAAITQRSPGADPVGALRGYLEADLSAVLQQESRPENLGYVVAVQDAPGLQARQRTLVELAGIRVAGRALVRENRRLVLDPELDAARRVAVSAAVPVTLAALEQCVRTLAGQLLGQPG
jgi:AcrR family transcriptional regulator